jgi:hypothetical protein
MVDSIDEFVRRTRLRRAIQIGLVGIAVLLVGLWLYSPADWANFFAGGPAAVLPRRTPYEHILGTTCTAIGLVLVIVSGVLFARIGRQPPVETDAKGRELIPRARVERDGSRREK